MVDVLEHYREVWLADFEFCQPPGERPEPICMVAREYRTGRILRVWADDLTAMSRPPFPIGDDALFVAYYASAELGCFLALDWLPPSRILDLFPEFRNLTNGLSVPCGNGLLGALAYFGLDGIESAAKDGMRDLAIRGGPYTATERQALLDYCESDVLALSKLLTAMLPRIDLSRALLRGRYMAAAASMEWTGTPIDTGTLGELRTNWEGIKTELIRKIDSSYGVFVPKGRRVNPRSKLGAAIYRESAESGVNPSILADAVEQVWKDDREQTGEFRDAVRAARKTTGLTINRIRRWEDSHRDYSTWPGLDVKAREVASEWPALGIGRGYDAADIGDDTDYAARLWDLLRDPIDKRRHKYDGDIISRAAGLAADIPPEEIYKLGPLSFSAERFAAWLVSAGIPWRRLPSGALALDDDTFREMARIYPEVAPLRELRYSLGKLRLLSDLSVGLDGRNRCLLSAFRATSSRNAPSSARFIFGPSCWLRSLIAPEAGRAVAYIDWGQQELGIAAALSGDSAMQEAYNTGDLYLAFAKQAGLAPPEATKRSHPAERERCKACILGVQYRMGSQSLADRLGQPEPYARELLELHRATYPTFWAWSEAAVNHAMLCGWLQTVFGWRVQVGPRANPRSLANFPMQANGAEMLRLACCLATERGIRVCCPIHDALLVEGPSDDIEAVVSETQDAMAEASRVVLDGFELRTDAEIVRYPERYMDPRGKQMWQTVMELLEGLTSDVETGEAVPF